MKLTITMELDNAAFADDDGPDEVERILAGLAERLPLPLEQTGGTLLLHDLNGHCVGEAEIVDDYA